MQTLHETRFDAASASMQYLGLSAAIQRGLNAAMQAEQAGHSFAELGFEDNDEQPDDSLLHALLAVQDRNLLRVESDLEPPTSSGCLLVLEDRSRLYLRRHWLAESAIARDIRARLQNAHESIVNKLITFVHAADESFAAANALKNHRFALVTGGPGSGKTSAAAKLALHYLLHKNAAFSRVLLAAPTGKAAARLESAFDSQSALLRAESNDAQHAAFDALNQAQALTLHRLLGYQPHQSKQPLFKRQRTNPIDADLVIVDEASMLSLELMQRLLAALHPDTALLLLGDAAQLPAVNCGRPFADLVEALAEHPAQPLATLTTQWRAQPALAELAAKVRLLEPESSVQLADCLVALEAYFPEPDINPGDLAQILTLRVHAGVFDDLMQADSLESAWQAAQSQRFLTPLKQGPQGQLALNAQLEAPLLARFPRATQIVNTQRFFAGKLLIATLNDPVLGLYNGDLLMAWPDSSGQLMLWFEQGGQLQMLALSLAKGLESAWVMTVHKAQGSEFDCVEVLLPAISQLGSDQLFDNALLYTAITRARITLHLHGDRATLRHALCARQPRNSGLISKLRAPLLTPRNKTD